eukprot:TRINITY_DN1925_c0_g1_i1.p1 TRINITY_DN1925_c0_g1~~TRINITY_DN1925_c0_g1_i1.p1  ORF type:complete len:427 (+),score=49.52 TRINITY_DN1925_c0_g1_i1:74-1354(+)
MVSLVLHYVLPPSFSPSRWGSSAARGLHLVANSAGYLPAVGYCCEQVTTITAQLTSLYSPGWTMPFVVFKPSAVSSSAQAEMPSIVDVVFTEIDKASHLVSTSVSEVQKPHSPTTPKKQHCPRRLTVALEHATEWLHVLAMVVNRLLSVLQLVLQPSAVHNEPLVYTDALENCVQHRPTAVAAAVSAALPTAAADLEHAVLKIGANAGNPKCKQPVRSTVTSIEGIYSADLEIDTVGPLSVCGALDRRYVDSHQFLKGLRLYQHLGAVLDYHHRRVASCAALTLQTTLPSELVGCVLEYQPFMPLQNATRTVTFRSALYSLLCRLRDELPRSTGRNRDSIANVEQAACPRGPKALQMATQMEGHSFSSWEACPYCGPIFMQRVSEAAEAHDTPRFSAAITQVSSCHSLSDWTMVTLMYVRDAMLYS